MTKRISWWLLALVLVVSPCFAIPWSALLQGSGAPSGGGGGGPSGAITAVWANDGGDKVIQDELRATGSPSSVYNTVWPSPGTTITLFGAKNEVISFNLVLEAATTTASNVSVTLSNLTGPGGVVIRSVPRATNNLFDWTGTEAELFFVRYLQIKGLSGFGYVGYSLSGGDIETQISAKLRLPLVGSTWTGGYVNRPNHDKFYPEIAVPLELNPNFSIAVGKNQSIWADVYIPKTAAPGAYTGTVTVSEGGVPTYTLPVSLAVNNFTLPDIPSSKTMLIYGPGEVAARYTTQTQTTVLKNHELVAHRHKISLVGGDSTQSGDQPGSAYLPVLTGSLFTSANGYAGPGVGSGTNIYMIGGYGSWRFPWGLHNSNITWASGVATVTTVSPHGFTIATTRTLTLADTYAATVHGGYNGIFQCTITGASTFTYPLTTNPGVLDPNGKGETISESSLRPHSDAWESWFQANSPATERFVYLSDEAPNFAQTQQWADWMKTNPGVGASLKSMATIQPIDSAASTPSLTITVGGFTAGLTSAWQNAVNTIEADSSKEYWMYNGPRPGQGAFSTEVDGTDLREKQWGQYKKGIARWFFWESTYYNDYQTGSGQKDKFVEARTFGSSNQTPDAYYGLRGSNGDGVLFYPGTDTLFPSSSYGIAGPIASLRLKHWRRGVQDVDYLTLAKAINSTSVTAIVQQMVPLVLWENTVVDPNDPTWYHDVYCSWSDNPDVWEATRAQLAAIIAPTFYIDPSAGTNGSGTQASPYNTWAGVSLAAGSTYLQKAGTVFNNILPAVGTGTSSSPIIIGSYGTGSKPQVRGIYLSAAHYITVRGFDSRAPGSFGVTVTNGSDNDTVTGCDISGSVNGVNMASGPGTNNSIVNNNIFGNSFFGIVTSGIAGPQTIDSNTVYDNGCGGVELNNASTALSNGITVTFNLFRNNGLTVRGCTGIHTYSAAVGDNLGNYNTIKNNISTGTNDSGSGDGNGIQFDINTHHNVAQGNISHNNNGEGVSIYGSSNNDVSNNIFVRNMTGLPANHGIIAEVGVINQIGVTNPSINNSAINNVISPLTGGTLYFTDNPTNNTLAPNYTGAAVHAAAQTWLTNFQSLSPPAPLLALAQQIIGTL